jgi:glycosyltransferase involved in cell wall biosynthesis
VAALADAIVSLVEDPARADALGAAGRARAQTQTWEAAARRVADIYGELLAQGGNAT